MPELDHLLHLHARKAVTVCVSVTILGVSEGGRAFECGLRAAVDCGWNAHLCGRAIGRARRVDVCQPWGAVGTEDVSGCFMCDDTGRLGLSRVVRNYQMANFSFHIFWRLDVGNLFSS